MTLQEIRNQRGVIQDDVAEQMGVTQTAVSRWESAKRPLPLHRFPELKRIYGVGFGELVEAWLEAYTRRHGDDEAMPGYLIYPGHRTLRPTVRSRRLTLRANLV